MLDPERLAWEVAITFAYAQCQARHKGLADAVAVPEVKPRFLGIF